MTDKEKYITFCRIFIRWLKQKGLYSRYMRGIKIRCEHDKYNNILKFFKNQTCCGSDQRFSYPDAKRVIDRTLWWRATHEGYDFWSSKNSEFSDFFVINFKNIFVPD